jgi:DNA-binding LacI/PurR family transcriptional regulator
MNPKKSSSTVTQSDVARKLGLTQATVSLALRDDPRITPERRKEIQAAAKKMGYRPNATATALAHFKKQSKVIPVQSALAWLNRWPDPKQLRRHGEFDLYWQGANTCAEKFGYHLEEFVCNDSMSLAQLQKVLTARGINGILLPPHQAQLDWSNFPWERFSVVRFGRSVAEPRAHLVTADQVADMMLAFEKTRQRGYERIAYVAGPVARIWLLFDAGYLMAQQRIEERLRLPMFRMDENNPYPSQSKFERWLKKEKPDAIVTWVAEVPEMLKKGGYRVPEDIGVAAMSVVD